MSEITISERAAERIRNIKKEKQISDKTPLRVGIVSGGCSGLTYDLDFDPDGVQENKQDHEFQDKGIHLVVDMRSFLYLAGTELDYTDGLNGEGFHFHNPNASRTCSCGESFAV
jgi:iron-sulfur cluster assembly protein